MVSKSYKEEKYLQFLANATKNDCLIYMNRYRLIDHKLYMLAFKKACEISAEKHKHPLDPLIGEFWGTVEAYTILLYEKHKRHIKPNRSLQKIKNLGERGAMSSWMDSKDAREGFYNLIEREMPEYTSEYLTIRYKNIADQFGHKFTSDQISTAEERLRKENFDISSIEIFE